MIKIKHINVSYPYDDMFSLDYLGKFSDEKGEFAIEHKGDIGSYEYFNAENVENVEQAQQNYDEYMQYEDGHKSLCGVQAEAIIYTSQNEACSDWLINKIHSGGCYGFDSDDRESLKEEAERQVEALKNTLKQLGFTDEHFINVEINL
jgi:hypothetical protein